MTLKEIYNERIDKYNDQMQKLSVKIGIFSLLRLLTAFIIMITVYLIFKKYDIYIFLILVSALFLFIWEVRYHSKLIDAHEKYGYLIRVNKEEISFLNNDLTPFKNGDEYIDPMHQFTFDLDIFGDKSIFQAVNRTTTIFGCRKLADYFSNCCLDASLIRKRQRAVDELSKLIDWRQSFESTGYVVAEQNADYEQIINWLNEKAVFISRPFYRYTVKIVPALTVVMIILSCLGVIPALIPGGLIIFQLILIGINLGYINHKALRVSKQIPLLKKYESLLRLIEDLNVDSEYLNNIRSSIICNNVSPCKEFEKLTKIVSSLDARNNVLGALLLDGIFLYDIYYVLKLELWMNRWKNKFTDWIDVIAEFEAISSLSNYKFNNPDFCVPEIKSGDFVLEAIGVSHPLLSQDSRVKNDYIQKEYSNLVIVTGANMAGKSTFLRTIGINMVLSMMGSCVCAERFIVTPILLRTSMRNTDSLLTNTSYFFAELKRLQAIVDSFRDGTRSYILLDEILKGTNSKDQHSGSARLIDNLLRLGAVGIVATHDIELTTLSEKYPKQIMNIAFEIEIDGEKMIFEYKYKNGICTKMNATHLMKCMNIFN